MNEIMNKFLLAGDKIMPEMSLRKPGVTYSACGPFTIKNKEKIQKFEETEDSRYIDYNQLDQGLVVAVLRIYLEEQLLIKYYVIKHLIWAKNPKYEGYQRGPALIVYKFFDIKLLLCAEVP